MGGLCAAATNDATYFALQQQMTRTETTIYWPTLSGTFVIASEGNSRGDPEAFDVGVPPARRDSLRFAPFAMTMFSLASAGLVSDCHGGALRR